MDGAAVFSVLGSIHLTWLVSKDGWQLCLLPSNFRPHQAACLSQTICLDEY